MRSEQNTIQEETRRRLPLGSLVQTTFEQFLRSIAAFVPKRAALVIDKDDVQAAGSDLSELIKAELVKRHMQQLQKELRQRRLQQIVADSQQKVLDLIAASELRKRGRQVRRMLQKQNRMLQKKWQQQFKRPPQTNRTFWIALGFGCGLALVGIITYQFLLRRLQQSDEEKATVELPYPDMSSQKINLTNNAPPDAVFVGVTGTKLYYPIETPLEQLSSRDDLLVDIVYFSSEQEADQQGFQPAQSHLPTASSRP